MQIDNCLHSLKVDQGTYSALSHIMTVSKSRKLQLDRHLLLNIYAFYCYSYSCHVPISGCYTLCMWLFALKLRFHFDKEIYGMVSGGGGRLGTL